MAVISRTDADLLIPDEISREIIKDTPQASVVLQRMRRLPNMARGVYKMPVLNALPTAYFVDGEGTDQADYSGEGIKKTTDASWTNKSITAEEVACIVPIPEQVIDDADYDIWAEIKPLIVEAFGKVVDAAVLFGTNAPTSWPDDILTGAGSASQTLELGAGGADIYDDLLGESGTFAMVEADGYMVTGNIADVSMKAKLRGCRDAMGVPIFSRSMQDKNRYELDGAPIDFPTNGAFAAASALMFSGDFSKAVYSIRQDVTYKVLTEAVIQNPSTGAILYNLAQQDMVALRCTMRLGWQLPNPVNSMQPTAADRYPFAVLIPAS